MSLKPITLDRIFAEEALYTFLCEFEFGVNQRPLTAISDDIKDYNVLAPNHFTIGETNTNPTTGQFDNSQINHHKKWENVRAATNMLWNRWRKEYLPTLTQRKKGLVHNRKFKIGDLVIVNQSNVPRSCWPLGRIIEWEVFDQDCEKIIKNNYIRSNLCRRFAYWPLGRIIETFPIESGVVLTVKVKNPNNEFRRHANKLHLPEVFD